MITGYIDSQGHNIKVGDIDKNDFKRGVQPK